MAICCPATRKSAKSSGSGHERHFRHVREESGLPLIADVLRQRSEATFRAKTRRRKGGRVRETSASAMGRLHDFAPALSGIAESNSFKRALSRLDAPAPYRDNLNRKQCRP